MEKWQLKQRQCLPLEVKIQMSLLRIRQWYETYNGEVYISFSGGKDSTVLLHLVRSIHPDVEAVFLDTGLEYPEIRNFVKCFENTTFIKPTMGFKDVIKKYGYPCISKEQAQYIRQYRTAKSEKTKKTRLEGNKYGMGKISEKWKFLLDAPFKISDECCDILKKNPAKKYEKLTGKKAYIGIIADESIKRKQDYIKFGCNSFNAKRPISRPLGFWTEQDILEYLKRNKIEICSVYGEIKRSKKTGLLRLKGLQRTGCVFCMFGVHMEDEPNRFQKLKITHPKLYDYCMKKKKDGGLGLRRVLKYIGVPYK